MLSNKIVFVTNLIDTIKFPFRKDKELYRSFYDMMGFYPHHIQHYKQALMHKSVSIKNEKGRPLNNERLEFLGDAILGAVVGDIVYQRFQGKREGFLTNARSKIVQRETLGKVATKVGFNKSPLVCWNDYSTCPSETQRVPAHFYVRGRVVSSYFRSRSARSSPYGRSWPSFTAPSSASTRRVFSAWGVSVTVRS